MGEKKTDTSEWICHPNIPTVRWEVRQGTLPGNSQASYLVVCNETRIARELPQQDRRSESAPESYPMISTLKP